MTDKVKGIARKNDELRRDIPFTTRLKDKIVMTQDFLALSSKERSKALEDIRNFNDFDEGNDPHEEHDCGLLVRNNAENIMFKIDYYDDEYENFMEDGNRVLTIMLASEY